MSLTYKIQESSTWNELSDNGIQIGVICPAAFEAKMLDVMKTFPSFVPLTRTYTREDQAPELARELMEQVEVLLFSGPIPYRRAKEKLRFTVPAHYIPLTGTGLYRALFEVYQKFGTLSLPMDTVARSAVDKTLKELRDFRVSVSCYDDKPFPSRRELIDFHVGLFRCGRSEAAVTGIRSVSEELTRLGVPNVWITPTEQDMIVSLERALLSTESRRSKESQIVVGLINIDRFDQMALLRGSEHEVQKLKLDIHRMLLGYVESLDGHLTHLGGDEYMFVTTRGIFERETGGYKSIPLAREAEKSLGVSLSIGIGFGSSANQAGTHARIALRQSKEAGGNVGFIVREDRGVIGPLEMTEPWEADLNLISADKVRKAEESGMTSVYLSKLVVDVSRRGKTRYTAQELAQLLNVTVRTAHRLLVVWLDEGLVRITGEERSNGKGRPKQIFDMTFISDVIRSMG